MTNIYWVVSYPEEDREKIFTSFSEIAKTDMQYEKYFLFHYGKLVKEGDTDFWNYSWVRNTYHPDIRPGKPEFKCFKKNRVTRALYG